MSTAKIRNVFFIAFSLCLPMAMCSPEFAYAGTDSCSDCISRKQRMCAEECDSVTSTHVRSCQKRCIAGYCSHRCEPNAPEILALTEESCEACLDRQYGLCEHHCPTGTPRVRALCQIGCAETRCGIVCKTASKQDIEDDKAKMVPIPAAKPKNEDEDDIDLGDEDNASLDSKSSEPGDETSGE